MGEVVFPLETKHFNIEPKDVERLWDGEWSISLNDDAKTNAGSLFFENGIFNGEVKMTADLTPEYDKSGYVKEIYYSMANFLFQFKDIREISTVCRHENDHRVRGLEKAGYVYRENKDGSDYYSIKKQKTAWTGFYVIIGFVAGFMIGIVLSNLWLGTIAGVLIGATMGYLMDKKENKD